MDGPLLQEQPCLGPPSCLSHHLLQLRACESSACEMLLGAKQVFQVTHGLPWLWFIYSILATLV